MSKDWYLGALDGGQAVVPREQRAERQVQRHGRQHVPQVVVVVELHHLRMGERQRAQRGERQQQVRSRVRIPCTRGCGVATARAWSTSRTSRPGRSRARAPRPPPRPPAAPRRTSAGARRAPASCPGRTACTAWRCRAAPPACARRSRRSAAAACRVPHTVQCRRRFVSYGTN